MQNFKFEKTSLEGAYIIKPFLAEDERGFFQKKFEKNIFYKNGIELNISETNISKSKKGVVRGLHFQTKYPQVKLVGVDFGRIFDVIVDLRKDSKTYGKWEGFELSDENKSLLYVPKGFAHGFIAFSEIAIVSYLCDGEYLKDYDSGILWSDMDLNIDWKLENIGGINNVIISEKDKKMQSFREYSRKIGVNL